MDKGSSTRSEDSQLPTFEVWKEYERIAMHFNDLLIKLRIQALAGVAALATIVGIFTKFDTDHTAGTWEIATAVLFTLCLLWIAIWVLDLLYYNRLLIGAVAALIEVEEASRDSRPVTSLVMSTRIEQSVEYALPKRKAGDERFYLLRGVRIFYGIVFASLFFGLCLSVNKLTTSPQPMASVGAKTSPAKSLLGD